MGELKRLFNPVPCAEALPPKSAVNHMSDSFSGVQKAVQKYLQETSDKFPLDEVSTQVFSQVLSTLHEYPCLETCHPLKVYLKSSVRLAWQMVTQSEPYYLDNDLKLGHFFPDRHERHPSSDPRGNFIREFVWPGLKKSDNTVLKAIVST